MGREVAILSCIRILFPTSTNLHDLPRTVLLAPLLDQVNLERRGELTFVGGVVVVPYESDHEVDTILTRP